MSVVSPAGVAPLLAGRGLVGLCAFADDDDLMKPPAGVVLVEEGGEERVVALDDPAARAELSAWARRPSVVVVLDSARPQLRRLLRAGVDVARPVCRHTLERLLGGAEDERLRFARDPELARARAREALSSLPGLIERAETGGQRKVARLESLVLRSFAALEDRGLPIDVKGWKLLVEEAKGKMQLARQEVFACLGDAVGRDLFGEPDLNLENDGDVKAVLERLERRALDDVGKHTLATLTHPVGERLLRYREASKIVFTYGDSFLEHVRRDSGRLHATFVPLGASTGRVASRDPNLQNLPSDESFHKCVRPGEGQKVVTADYGTCELRILAELCGDEKFLAAFEQDLDLHCVVAEEMFGERVTKTENAHLRKKAKAINFGLVYGMGAAALGNAVGTDANEAARLLERYFERFPRVRRYLEGSVDQALAKGYAETVVGRRLSFDPDTLSADNARGELSRIAKNMPIQGTSADMTKLAMVRVHERLLEDFADAALINTVHDELVVECRAEDADSVARAVAIEMGAAHSTLLRRVPPKVEVEVADHWKH